MPLSFLKTVPLFIFVGLRFSLGLDLVDRASRDVQDSGGVYGAFTAQKTDDDFVLIEFWPPAFIKVPFLAR